MAYYKPFLWLLISIGASIREKICSIFIKRETMSEANGANTERSGRFVGESEDELERRGGSKKDDDYLTVQI